METGSLLRKRIIWWIVGSLGVTGIAALLLGFILVFALLGSLVTTSDASKMAGIEVPDTPEFDIPLFLLPIYIQAEQEHASWARLAAIHQVTTDFGAKKAKRTDTIGALGFPRSLWEGYRVDGDSDGKIDPDNPYDAIFSLANYLQLTAQDLDEALVVWFGSSEEVALVYRKEAEYAALLSRSGTWLWPLAGYTTISSPFGYRVDPVTGAQGAFHAGIDIPAPRGTPVLAVLSGTVTQVIHGSTGYGNAILLQHANGLVSLYGHLTDIGVCQRQQVLQGEVIGWVGSTGKSTGPHLHLEIRVNGQKVDPLPYFRQLDEP